MRFLIQSIQGEIKHDFSIALLEAINFNNWKHNFLPYMTIELEDLEYITGNVIPIGSVEFVLEYMSLNGIEKPKPKNVPEILFKYAGRNIYNGTHIDVLHEPRCFIKSNDYIKDVQNGEIGGVNSMHIREGNYQISDILPDIQSEWRAFVFKGKIVGLQNYLGDFTAFPDVDKIQKMIDNYTNAPRAYTMDVFVCNRNTHLMEVHDFFSVGFYGFSDYRIIPAMFSQWFCEYTRQQNFIIESNK